MMPRSTTTTSVDQESGHSLDPEGAGGTVVKKPPKWLLHGMVTGKDFCCE